MCPIRLQPYPDIMYSFFFFFLAQKIKAEYLFYSCIISCKKKKKILWPSNFNPASLTAIIQVIRDLVKGRPALGTEMLVWSSLCNVIWVCLGWDAGDLGWENRRQ